MDTQIEEVAIAFGHFRLRTGVASQHRVEANEHGGANEFLRGLGLDACARGPEIVSVESLG
jgi:hypothetical protein